MFRRKLLQQPITVSWENDKMASLDWWDSFRKRHIDIALRSPENISSSRAATFNQKKIDAFFNDLQRRLTELSLDNSPHLIYNVDETGLSSAPSKGSKVIAPKGCKNVYKIQCGERGTLTTVVPCFWRIAASFSYFQRPKRSRCFKFC